MDHIGILGHRVQGGGVQASKTGMVLHEQGDPNRDQMHYIILIYKTPKIQPYILPIASAQVQHDFIFTMQATVGLMIISRAITRGEPIMQGPYTSIIYP